MTLRTTMTPRRTRWAWAGGAALVLAVAAIGVLLPNEYDCAAFAVRGGKVTSMELRHVTCAGAMRTVRAVRRGEGRPSRDGSGLAVREWRCSDTPQLTRCLRPGEGSIRAHVFESGG